jgi:S-adenosylmethionine synthetase
MIQMDLVLGRFGPDRPKIIIDTYGGWDIYGEDAFSGKDYSKVDQSAAYAALRVSKSLVKADLCKIVLIQVGPKVY